MLRRVDPNNPMEIILAVDAKCDCPTIFVCMPLTTVAQARMQAAAAARRQIALDSGASPTDPEIQAKMRESDCGFIAATVRKIKNWPGDDGPVEVVGQDAITDKFVNEMLGGDWDELTIRMTRTLEPQVWEGKAYASQS